MSIAPRERKNIKDDYCTCKRQDCAYKAAIPPYTCDYILIVGEPRGCKVEECNKYKKGKMFRRNVNKIVIVPKSNNY